MMTDFSVLRSRLTVSLTTPHDSVADLVSAQ
jgi:hypothetical protein